MDNVERIQFIMEKMHGSATGDVLRIKIPEWLHGINMDVPENVSYYLIQRLRDENLILPTSANPAYDRLTRKAIDIINTVGHAKYIANQFSEKAHQEKIAKYTYRIQLSIAITTGIAALYYFVELVHRLENWCK